MIYLPLSDSPHKWGLTPYPTCHTCEKMSTEGWAPDDPRTPKPGNPYSTHPMGVPLLASLESFAIAFE